MVLKSRHEWPQAGLRRAKRLSYNKVSAVPTVSQRARPDHELSNTRHEQDRKEQVMSYAQLATDVRMPRPIGFYRMGGMPQQSYANQARKSTSSKWVGVGLVAVIASIGGVVAYQKLSEPAVDHLAMAPVTTPQPVDAAPPVDMAPVNPADTPVAPPVVQPTPPVEAPVTKAAPPAKPEAPARAAAPLRPAPKATPQAKPSELPMPLIAPAPQTEKPATLPEPPPIEEPKPTAQAEAKPAPAPEVPPAPPAQPTWE
jgi:hypothetical protein